VTETKVERIFRTSRKTYTSSLRKTPVLDYSDTLYAVEISQDTTYRNSAETLENASKKCVVKPEVSANMERSQAEERLKEVALCGCCPVKLYCPSKTVCDENDSDS
jgi:hypothetical protein